MNIWDKLETLYNRLWFFLYGAVFVVYIFVSVMKIVAVLITSICERLIGVETYWSIENEIHVLRMDVETIAKNWKKLW